MENKSVDKPSSPDLIFVTPEENSAPESGSEATVDNLPNLFTLKNKLKHKLQLPKVVNPKFVVKKIETGNSSKILDFQLDRKSSKSEEIEKKLFKVVKKKLQNNQPKSCSSKAGPQETTEVIDLDSAEEKKSLCILSVKEVHFSDSELKKLTSKKMSNFTMVKIVSTSKATPEASKTPNKNNQTNRKKAKVQVKLGGDEEGFEFVHKMDNVKQYVGKKTTSSEIISNDVTPNKNAEIPVKEPAEAPAKNPEEAADCEISFENIPPENQKEEKIPEKRDRRRKSAVVASSIQPSDCEITFENNPPKNPEDKVPKKQDRRRKSALAATSIEPEDCEITFEENALSKNIEEVKTSKKRGRTRKSQLVAVNEGTSDCEITFEEIPSKNIEEQAVKTPKKRGRKRKSSVMEKTLEAVEIVEEILEETPRKKPGRKSKAAKSLDESPVVVLDEPEAIEVEDTSKPTPKRRGRPRKSDVSTPTTIAPKEKVSPSRHSRRMRKEINYFDLANPKDLEDAARGYKRGSSPPSSSTSENVEVKCYGKKARLSLKDSAKKKTRTQVEDSDDEIDLTEDVEKSSDEDVALVSEKKGKVDSEKGKLVIISLEDDGKKEKIPSKVILISEESSENTQGCLNKDESVIKINSDEENEEKVSKQNNKEVIIIDEDKQLNKKNIDKETDVILCKETEKTNKKTSISESIKGNNSVEEESAIKLKLKEDSEVIVIDKTQEQPVESKEKEKPESILLKTDKEVINLDEDKPLDQINLKEENDVVLCEESGKPHKKDSISKSKKQVDSIIIEPEEDADVVMSDNAEIKKEENLDEEKLVINEQDVADVKKNKQLDEKILKSPKKDLDLTVIKSEEDIGVTVTDNSEKTEENDKELQKNQDLVEGKTKNTPETDTELIVKKDDDFSPTTTTLADKTANSEDLVASSAIDDTITNTSDLDTSVDASPNLSKVSDSAKKYNKSGATTAMMDSLFSNFQKGTGLDSVKDGEAADSSYIKRKPGRKKKIPLAAEIETGCIKIENNKVTCTACKNKIHEDSWSDHNENVHYNLAWRVGEEPLLDIDKNKFVLSTVKAVMKSKKKPKMKLICDKCGNVLDNANEFVKHWLVCDGTNSLNVTCAVCNVAILKNQWTYHKLRHHNNLAWRLGDKPLDLNNRNFVLGVLNAIYKSKKPLFCNKCGSSKKSVIGFLSHQSMCMKTDEELEDLKEQCKLCSAKVMPVSMPTHIKTVHLSPKPDKNSKNENNSNEAEEEVSGKKRKAATRALNVIHNYTKDGSAYKFDHFCVNLDFQETKFVRKVLERQFSENEFIQCKFQECEDKYSEINSFLEHITSCKMKPNEYFACKHCLLISGKVEIIVDHLKTVHSIRVKIKDVDFDVEKLDDDDLDEKEEQFRVNNRKSCVREKKKAELDPKYKIKPLCIITPTTRIKLQNALFEHAYDWTLEFHTEYYNNLSLFNDLRKVLPLLDTKLIADFLPSLYESCDVARTSVVGYKNCLGKEYDFRKYDLFESELYDNGNSIIFCGNPINSMAWLPFPSTAEMTKNQILAVATLTSPDKKCHCNKNYQEKSVIQFWNFGPLRNRTCNSFVPELAFSICLDYGPIWHLEWCPSGCYDVNLVEENKGLRLGLLAVAGSQPFVNIYSIPALNEGESGLFYEAQPVLRLQLGPEGESSLSKQNYYPTKLSWSKASGHKYIAVGYTNGMVALYDICTPSKLLWQTSKDVTVILPYKTLQMHSHYIAVLHLYHLNGGNRWLLTGSVDKGVFVWDLENNTKITTGKRNIVSDGLWLTNWLTCLVGEDESVTTNMSIHTFTVPIRNHLSEQTYMTHAQSTISTITSSDWLNSFIQGNTMGEITFMMPNQLLYCLDSNKRLKTIKFLLGFTNLLEKGKTPKERMVEEEEKVKALKKSLKIKNDIDESLTKPEDVTHLDYNPHYFKYEPITYKQAEEKYGLLFCDTKMDSFKDFPDKMGEQLSGMSPHFQIAKPNLYPLQSVNKIAFNPNLQASTYFATGYQAGFVRLSRLRFLDKDEQVV